MPLRLRHKDAATIVLTEADRYGKTKVVVEQHGIVGTFLQNTGLFHTNNQDLIESDAVFYPDHTNAFVVANYLRLEGMFLIALPFGGAANDGWYKITSVTINRDHLLGNSIDNILLTLKKTDSLPGVS